MTEGEAAEPVRRWTVERVMAAAPDSASAVAGRKLAGHGPWSELGAQGPVIWGRCRGSAREPYRVVVDTAVPRYQCTCPSRKFPCKHALGLLFHWAEGRFPGTDDGVRRDPGGDTPPWARVAAAPGETEGAGAAGPGGGQEEADQKAAAAAARAAERDERVVAGLAELERWLTDRISDGLGRLAARPELFEELAARMIDAQAPGIARRLRRLATLPTGADDWAATVLAELALIGLLGRAFDQRETLDRELAATVRAHLGFTVPRASVLAGPATADRWSVFGLHDTEDDERVSTRRVWLIGRDTGRFAVVLLFSINGAPYEMTVAPGMELDADVHFYPGRPALRALIGNRRDERPRTRDWTRDGDTVAAVRTAWATAIAADPWLTLWPAAVRGRIGTARTARGVAFQLQDPTGDQLAVSGPEPMLWQALAVSGGATATWFGELRPDGFSPLALVDAEVTGAEVMVL